MAKQKPFSEQLRAALQKSSKTRYAISKETGIAQSILARFVNDGAGLSLASVDKLCEALGVGLAGAAKPAAGAKRKA